MSFSTVTLAKFSLFSACLGTSLLSAYKRTCSSTESVGKFKDSSVVSSNIVVNKMLYKANFIPTK